MNSYEIEIIPNMDPRFGNIYRKTVKAGALRVAVNVAFHAWRLDHPRVKITSVTIKARSLKI